MLATVFAHFCQEVSRLSLVKEDNTPTNYTEGFDILEYERDAAGQIVMLRNIHVLHPTRGWILGSRPKGKNEDKFYGRGAK